jgi:hypothetical protein
MYTCNQTFHEDKGKRHLTDNDSNQDYVNDERYQLVQQL